MRIEKPGGIGDGCGGATFSLTQVNRSLAAQAISTFAELNRCRVFSYSSRCPRMTASSLSDLIEIHPLPPRPPGQRLARSCQARRRRAGRARVDRMTNDITAAAAGTWDLGGDLTVNRIGYGAMQ